jgi:hypothetical protein
MFSRVFLTWLIFFIPNQRSAILINSEFGSERIPRSLLRDKRANTEL